MNKTVELDNIIVTLGTDLNKKFSWCLRKVNGVDCVCLHERAIDGDSFFNEDDFITAIPLRRIEFCIKVLAKE